MSDLPKTLFQLAGADPRPAALSDAALILIDCQEEYRSGPLALPGVEPALAEAAVLLERARSLGRPVVPLASESELAAESDLLEPQLAAESE